MAIVRSFYAVYDTKKKEQCVMIDTLNRIAKHFNMKERSIRKAMYLKRNIKRRYFVEKV